MLGLVNTLTSGGVISTVLSNTYSLAFDGTDDYVDVADDNSLDFGTGDFSVGLWHKSGTEGDQPFIGKKAVFSDSTAGWVIYMQNSPDVMRCRIGDGGSSNVATSIEDDAGSTLVADDNQWHHTVMVRSGDNLYLYFDGVLGPDGSKTGVNDFNVNNTESLYIGKSASRYPAMSADEVSIWDAALSAGSISTIYNSGVPTDLNADSNAGNLVGWWRMGDGTEGASGTTIYDMSTNSNNGTMTNMDPATDYVTDVPS